MNNSPLVSIIIPVYNSERFLKECFESILAQTFEDYEVLVVDDGSSDSSLDIEDQYYDQLIENFLSSENCDSIKDDIEVDPMTVLDIVQKLSVLIENKSDLKRPRKNKITKSLEDRKKDALETIKTKITIEQFCDLALNVLKIPKMGDSVNITKDDLKAKNITKVERKLKEYEE